MEGQASQLGNLGSIALDRGELDEAEKLVRESLELNCRLGRLEGQASEGGKLGSIAAQRGATADARRLWTESRDLFARLGMDHKVKQLQNCLDGLSAK
jgi:Flp pilus assembly protein TadD